MLPFSGTHPLVLDQKQRLLLAKFRDRLKHPEFGPVVSVTAFPEEGVLRIYPAALFKQYCEKQAGDGDSLTVPPEIERLYARTEEIKLDGTGRITIPKRLLLLVGLSAPSKVVVEGGGKYLKVRKILPGEVLSESDADTASDSDNDSGGDSAAA